MYFKYVVVILFLFAMASSAHAECYNEDACYKDYVNHDNKDVVIAVNRDTNQVELYWSEKAGTWVKPGREYQESLQKIYDKKLRLQNMQKRLDRMHNDTWYNTNQSSGAGRR